MAPLAKQEPLIFQIILIFGGTVSSKAIDNFGVGSNEIDQLQQDYELRFTGVIDSETVNGKKVIYTKSGGSMATVFRSQFAFTDRPDNTAGVDGPYLTRIPFEVWNISDPNNPRQVNCTFRDRLQTADSDPFYTFNTQNRIYAIIVNSDYDPNQVIQVDDGPDDINKLATWVVVFWSTNYTSLEDKVQLTYANPLQIGKDTFTFTIPKGTYSDALAKEDVSKINVFPNPYYGINSQELSKYSKYVTFNHLPAQTPATIRIFNLAGFQVKSIEHASQSQFEQWDLNNESGLPVSSGIYIAYIDMPKLGQTKILKFAIIQEQQIPDHF